MFTVSSDDKSYVLLCFPQFLLSTLTPGGTGISEQIAELKRGAEIIVCTPGRMIDMLAANSGKVRLFDGAGQHSGGRISHKLKIKQFDAISSSLLKILVGPFIPVYDLYSTGKLVLFGYACSPWQ